MFVTADQLYRKSYSPKTAVNEILVPNSLPLGSVVECNGIENQKNKNQ